MKLFGFSKRSVTQRCLWAIVTLLFLAVDTTIARADDWTFRVQYAESVHQNPYTGRVYLLFSRSKKEPRTGPGWFKPELFVTQDVENWKPGETITFSNTRPESLLTYPRDIAEIQPAGYRAQAVARFNPYDRNIGTGVGNGYSQTIRVSVEEEPPLLLIDQIVQEQPFRETDQIKLIRVRSKRLSDFHNRDVFFQAAVTLPKSYHADSERRYPTIFTVPGFTGTHFDALRRRTLRREREDASGVEFLQVRFDPRCMLGHHVFANSANNGPVGTALVTEFLPEFERNFRAIAEPSARFLTGHSSGGWSSLWLQVAYPDVFGGTWSTAPDPVDFRDFQRINLYQPGENMYVNAQDERRPLARMRGRVLLWYQGFADMEHALGYGGQLHSFEAVFSPRGSDGKPRLIWDRQTGKIDTEVTKTWEKYDIRLILERNWPTLGEKLTGKLHIFMGDTDTFYLEGATVRLKKSLEKLGSDAVVEIHAGKNHFTLLSPALQKRIHSEMAETFLKLHPNN